MWKSRIFQRNSWFPCTDGEGPKWPKMSHSKTICRFFLAFPHMKTSLYDLIGVNGEIEFLIFYFTNATINLFRQYFVKYYFWWCTLVTAVLILFQFWFWWLLLDWWGLEVKHFIIFLILRLRETRAWHSYFT